MSEALQRLLERLQTGWQPTAADIPAEVRQNYMADWEFLGPRRGHRVLLYSAATRELSGGILWIDSGLRWALADDAVFWWLGDDVREVNST